MYHIELRAPRFRSLLDEMLFFEWIQKIRAVRKWTGQLDTIVLYVTKNVSDKSLRELIGLCFRYDLDPRQLAQFLSRKNKRWFANPESFWYERVFSKAGNDSLVDDLLESDPAFQSLVVRSKVSPRKPFTPGTEST